KDKARPITKEERATRLDKARQLMPSNEIDAILLMEGTSLNYFTGIRWWGGERFFAMILPAKGQPFYVCPAFEEVRAREQIADGPDGDGADVRTWQEDENPYPLVSQGLKDRELATATLGIEETVRFSFSNGVAKASPQTKIVNATAVTAGCRMIKSAHELELMKLASQVTLAAFDAVYKALREGLTKTDLENLVEAAHKQLGFSGEADIMLGESSAFPHGSTAERRDSRGQRHYDGWRLSGRRIRLRYHAHLRAGKAKRQDEEGLRDRAPGPKHSLGDSTAGFSLRSG